MQRKHGRPGWLILAIASISNPQWKRAREMVADIGHRYISEGAKGNALEHKKIASPYSKRQPPLRFYHLHPLKPPSLPPSFYATGVHNHPPIYGAFCTFDIFYCRSPLFVLFMFLLGTTLGSPFAVSALAWPASTPGQVPRPLSCEIHPLRIRTVDRPLDISKDLLAMQTRRYIKTIYFAEA